MDYYKATKFVCLVTFWAFDAFLCQSTMLSRLIWFFAGVLLKDSLTRMYSKVRFQVWLYKNKSKIDAAAKKQELNELKLIHETLQTLDQDRVMEGVKHEVEKMRAFLRPPL